MEVPPDGLEKHTVTCEGMMQKHLDGAVDIRNHF
jgi:hypothetical protein